MNRRDMLGSVDSPTEVPGTPGMRGDAVAAVECRTILMRSSFRNGIGETSRLQEAMEPRTKPIVFWGVWLYFGPTAAIAGTVAYTSLAGIFSGSPDGQEVAGAVAIAVMCGLYLASSCWALWAVTAGCFKRR